MTLEDKIRVELAAKAISLDIPKKLNSWITYTDSQGFRWWNIDGRIVEQSFNPLNNDADNRQLQVKLRLSLIPCESGGWVVCSYDPETHEEKWLVAGLEPNRAVVTAAAIIGQKMK